MVKVPVVTMLAMLEPAQQWKELELKGDYTSRLALMEEQKSLPFGAVWDYHCLRSEVPVGIAFMDEVSGYESRVLAARE